MKDKRYEEYLTIKKDEFWCTPYIGRRVNDIYSSIFDHNGYFPSDDYNKYPEYDENGIIINLHPVIKNNVIDSISYYKKVDHGIYYRGADYKALNSHDIKVFKTILDECTESDAPEILERILELPLSEGWCLERTNPKSIVISNNGKKTSVPREYTEYIIDLARLYPDITCNDDFWNINRKLLKSQYKNALFAMLGSFNRKNFPNVSFAETANERIVREDNEERLKNDLINGIRNNDLQTVKRLVADIDDVSREVVQTAVDNSNTHSLEIIASHITDCNTLKIAGIYAIKQSETDLLYKLLENREPSDYSTLIYPAYLNGKIEYVTLLLDKGCTLTIQKDHCALPVRKLLPLTNYYEVVWPVKYLQDLYGLEDHTYLKKVLGNYHTEYSDGKKCHGYNWIETSNIVKWILNTRDYELIDFAAMCHIQEAGIKDLRNSDIFLQAFEEGGEYWEHTKALFKDVPHCCADLYYKCVMDNKPELLKRLIECSGIGVNGDILHRAIEGYSSKTETLKILIDYYDAELPSKRNWRPIWEDVVYIRNNEVFEYFFMNYKEFYEDEAIHNAVIEYAVKRNLDSEKKQILIDKCGVDKALLA